MVAFLGSPSRIIYYIRLQQDFKTHYPAYQEKTNYFFVYLFSLPLIVTMIRNTARFTIHNNLLFLTIFFLAPSLAFAYLVYQSTTISRILLTDQTKFRHWLKTPNTQVTAEELLHLLCLYQSTEYSRRLVATVRERNALIASEISENLINELSLKLDSEIRSKPLTSDFAASEFFRSWMEKYTRNDNLRLKNLGTEFLDEIYITLEQIRSKRKSTDADIRSSHNRPAVISSSDCGR
jgi:hypothetical protein